MVHFLNSMLRGYIHDTQQTFYGNLRIIYWGSHLMVQAGRKIFRNPDKVYSFREDFLQLYSAFKVNIEALCKKYDVRIDYWYSPSAIPQPKFVIENAGFTADELHMEKELLVLSSKRKREMDINKSQLFDPALLCR